MLTETNGAVSQLIIYAAQTAPILIDNPDTDMLIVYLGQLQNAEIQSLALCTSQGRMLMTPYGSKLLIKFEDQNCVVIRPDEIISRQVGAEIALFFLENAGMPARRCRTSTLRLRQEPVRVAG